MKKAIVTGAGGFVGSRLVKELTDNDVFVYAVVRQETSLPELLTTNNLVRIVYCDMSELEILPDLIKDDDIDLFYHLAWKGTSGKARGDYNLQIDNIKYSCNAVVSAHKINCKKFVYAGSIMEYESMSFVPQDGSSPGMGFIYSIAKQTAHHMTKTLAASFKIDFVSALISNIYGPGEESERFINTVINKFLKNEKMSFTSAEQLYDFIYITDAVYALYLIGPHGKNLTSYYIGNSEPRPLIEFIRRVYDSIKPDFNLVFGDLPSNGASLSYDEFDTSKLLVEFGFNPKTSFEVGVMETAEWIKNRNI